MYVKGMVWKPGRQPYRITREDQTDFCSRIIGSAAVFMPTTAPTAIVFDSAFSQDGDLIAAADSRSLISVWKLDQILVSYRDLERRPGSKTI